MKFERATLVSSAGYQRLDKESNVHDKEVMKSNYTANYPFHMGV